MRSSTLFWLVAASAAGYLASRRLMEMPESELAMLPKRARGPAARVRARLLAARAHAEAAWREGVAERNAAQRDMTQEYEHRSGRR